MPTRSPSLNRAAPGPFSTTSPTTWGRARAAAWGRAVRRPSSSTSHRFACGLRCLLRWTEFGYLALGRQHDGEQTRGRSSLQVRPYTASTGSQPAPWGRGPGGWRSTGTRRAWPLRPGGGCTTVGAAGGFTQGDGFGSFSKRYGYDPGQPVLRPSRGGQRGDPSRADVRTCSATTRWRAMVRLVASSATIARARATQTTAVHRPPALGAASSYRSIATAIPSPCGRGDGCRSCA